MTCFMAPGVQLLPILEAIALERLSPVLPTAQSELLPDMLRASARLATQLWTELVISTAGAEQHVCIIQPA